MASNRFGRYLLATCAVLWAVDATAQLPWQVWSSPTAMARLDARGQVLERSSHCYGGCRYDRDGVGSEPPAGNPYPDRFLYRDGNGDAVIFDERGPGALTRLWLTTGFNGLSYCIDPSIVARFYVDGVTTPTLSLPLARLFDGKQAPFLPPLAFDRSGSSGGFVSYVPIAYQSSLRISLSDPAAASYQCTIDGNTTTVPSHLLWYQLQFQRLAPETVVTSFTPAATYSQFASWLAHAGDNPWQDTLISTNASLMLMPGGSVGLPTVPGSGWLRGIELGLPAANYGDVALTILIDGATAVDLPLSEFFGASAGDTVSPRGVLFGRSQGKLYAWFPMPFVASLGVSLRALPSLSTTVNINTTLSTDIATPVPAEAGRFFAARRQMCGGGDVEVLSVRGAGKIVGVSAQHAADGASDPNYLESDERLYFDGATQPGWYGTGLEDFYNGAFYFEAFRPGGPVPFATPLAGASRVDIFGTTAAWRLLPTDSVTYQNRLVWRWEAGAAPNLVVPTCSTAVFYGYAQSREALVPYGGFDLGSASAIAHGYVTGGGATCSSVGGSFEDEPPTARTAMQCRFASGSSFFHFAPAARAQPLRLRRTLDVSQPSTAAEIWVNGVKAGEFSFAGSDPLRRWQQQDVVLDAAAFAPSGTLNFEIRPLYSAPGNAGGFSDSAYELWGGWTDLIFADGFN